MSGAVRVLLPPVASQLSSLVVAAGCTPVIDATAGATPEVPAGAWVRTRPGRPAPGTGPVVLAEFGAPVPDRETWLETSVPRDVPAGYAGLVLKGIEAGGSHGEESGLSLLAQCPDPSRVILDAGCGPDTAAAAAAMGADVLVAEAILGCPELALPTAMARRLGLADDEVTHSLVGLRVASGLTSPVVRALARGDDPWVLARDLWQTGDPSRSLWMAGQGLALARELAERFGGLEALLRAYVDATSTWKQRVARASVAEAGAPAGTGAALMANKGMAVTDGPVGSAVLWQEASWIGRPVVAEPALAALATGGAVVGDADQLGALQEQHGEAAPEPAPAPAPVVAPAPATPSVPAVQATPKFPEPSSEAGAAIAIIGLGCRLPGADDVAQFWDNILNGRSAIGDVPKARWDASLYFDPDKSVPDKTYTQIGAFLENFEFDSKRFRIPPKVARQIDPVQQITLASVADALVDADLKLDRRSEGREFDRERCAVILGNALGGEIKEDHALRVRWPEVAAALERTSAFQALPPAQRERLLADMEVTYRSDWPEVDEDSMAGELSNVIAGRIANAFDLGGANFTVDAACASSMAAIQAAVKGLQTGDFDMAVTGGADRSMDIATYVKFCKIGALSPDHSSPFDASANGFVMGEGCGILVLKRLEDAVKDGDKIYAVIRGVGASSDGKGKGITAPNIKGQIRALERAWNAAGLEPSDVDLVEAHGTSTVVGDKVEVEALTEVIGAGRRGDRGPVRLGSVKSMIGHLKSAAGAAATIKAALALHHGILPPSLGFTQAREDVPMDKVPFQVQTRAEPWPHAGLRRAGVSAFGFGGTNFHVVLESWSGQPLPASVKLGPPPAQAAPAVPVAAAPIAAPAPAPVAAAAPAPARVVEAIEPAHQPPAGIWATSAQTRAQLVENLEALLEGRDAPWNPSDQLRIAAAPRDDAERKAQLERALKVVRKGSNPEMLRARSIYLEDAPSDGKLCMTFTGQGSQYLDMGLDLAAHFPVVAETFAEADRILTPELGKPISEFIRLRDGEDADAKAAVLQQTEYSQPATLTMDVALLRLLASYGVAPDMVAGHSLGEYGAAVAAGIMTFEQALYAVSARGREMANVKLDDFGKMAGVATRIEVVEEVLAEVQGYVIAANKNCPSQTVIAGASDAVDEAVERFRARGVTVYRLPVSHAFHSRIVSPASDPLRGMLGKLGLQAPRRPITTNVTAEYYPTGPDASDRIIDLLAQQISAPVEWTSQIERMYADGARIFVECGPKRALTGFAVSILKRRPHRALYTNHPKRGGVHSFLDALAGLLVLGFPVRAEAGTQVPDLFAEAEPRRATTAAVLARSALTGEATEAIPDVSEGILRIVASKTGYQTSELDLEFELEADLGIDTVKQAEIFAVVRETYSIPTDPDFRFSDYRTLRSVIDWAAQRIGATRPAHEPEPEVLREPAPAAVAAPATPLLSEAAVQDFLTGAMQAGMSVTGAEGFARALLPSVQGLLAAAWHAFQQAQPPAPAPVAAAPAPVAQVVEASYATDLKVVCTGASLGLPGGEQVFDPRNIQSMLAGENRISHIGDRAERFLGMNLERLVKDPRTGEGKLVKVEELDSVIRLAGVKGHFDLGDWGVPQSFQEAYDITTALAIAAGLEALKDAGIPLVQRFSLSKSGKKVPKGWVLPEGLRDDTGIVVGSCFPGYDRLIKAVQAVERGTENFDRRFLFRVLAMAHSQFAQFIGARGPAAIVNAACASTTQALQVAEDMIRAGRCRRVIVVGADDVTNETLLDYIGSGFLGAGAAADGDKVEEVALPFDARRNGLVLGMGGVGLVLERQEDAVARGVQPITEMLGSHFVNSAFHGTRLDPSHIAREVGKLVDKSCAKAGVTREQFASRAAFLSHETYTPARGGSAQAEIEALRRTFGSAASQIVVTNTKGFTGHPMGVGIEDTIAVKGLQYGRMPPVANFKVPDPGLGDLTLSKGESRDYEFVLRLAAGFGSQLALTTWRRVARGNQRDDRAKRIAWLREVTGFAHVEERIEQRTLRAYEADVDLPLPFTSDLEEDGVDSETTVVAGTPGAPATPSDATVVEEAPRALDSAGVLRDLTALVAEKTGYAPDELEPDFELEADLGIDTVKQAEIFSELRERYGLERDDEFRLADHPTLEALASYLAGQMGDTTRQSEPEAHTVVGAPAALPDEATQVLDTPTAGDVQQDTLEALVDLIAEKTGYATDELELDFELEADLGIDTVKQAEIFSELRERWGLERDEDFRLADYPTIESLASYLGKRRGQFHDDTPTPPTTPSPTKAPATAAAPKPAPVAETQVVVEPAETLEALVALIAEKTGYDPEELEHDFELEADLGIDTVKQAEIFSELRERWGLARDEDFRLADYPTIESLAAYLTAQRSQGGAAPVETEAAPEAPAASTPAPSSSLDEALARAEGGVDIALDETQAQLSALIAEKTGYDVDELEPDFELEADLGIDTVKQAEIFSELRDRWQIPRDDDFRLADYPTIEALAAWLHQRRVEAATGAPEPTLAPDATVAVEEVEEPVDSELPESFRLRQPVLVPVGRRTPARLHGCSVRVLGEGSLAQAVRDAVLARGGSLDGEFCAVVDVGSDVLDSFHLAQGLVGTPPKHWVTVTRMGELEGGFPLDVGYRDGARAGFTKAVGREWQETRAVVVDVPPSADDAAVAEAACDELGFFSGPIEIFRDGEQSRCVELRTVPVPDSGPLTGSPVVLVTGGGRGITAQVAKELAARGPVVLALVGRGPAGQEPLDEAGERERIKASLKATGQRVTPMEIERRLAPLRKADEIRANIAEMEALGATVQYFRADLADPQAVGELVAEVQGALGNVDICIHGAGVEESRLIQDKDDTAFHRVFDGKAAGGLGLVAALSAETVFVSMGSVSGRFGNQGQVDYSAANDAMARLCQTRPRSLHIDWTAWDDVGMAVRGGMKRLLEDRGVDLLPAPAGAKLLVDLIVAGQWGELVVAGRLGGFLPPPAHPLLDRVEYDGDDVRGYRALSLETDPWLEDHAIDGKPVLPGVFGLELMAATAGLVLPGMRYQGARDVSFSQPVKLYRNQPTRVRVEATPTGTPGEVRCLLISERLLRTGREMSTEHFAATIVLGREDEVGPLPSAFFPDEEVSRAAIYRRFFHGPLFQVLTGVQGVGLDGLLAEALTEPATIAEGLLTTPLSLESAFQAAGLHRMITAGIMGLPSQIGTLRVLRSAEDGEKLTLMVQQQGDAYDVDVDGTAGPVLRLRGFVMADLGPLSDGDRFPEPEGGRFSCLAPAVERAEAGPDDIVGLWLTEEEQEELSRRGTARRIADRVAGRIAAKKALHALTGVAPLDIRVPSASSGEPVALVPGHDDVRVTISHTDGTAVAVAATGLRLGLDREVVAPRPAAFSEDWFRPAELASLTDDRARTVAWCVKEAVLKALGTGMAVSPREVQVQVGDGSATVQLHGEAAATHRRLGGGALEVRWHAHDAGVIEALVHWAA